VPLARDSAPANSPFGHPRHRGSTEIPISGLHGRSARRSGSGSHSAIAQKLWRYDCSRNPAQLQDTPLGPNLQEVTLGLRLTVIESPLNRFDASTWWRSGEGRKVFAYEVIRWVTHVRGIS
jgi:hypothetical protein